MRSDDRTTNRRDYKLPSLIANPDSDGLTLDVNDENVRDTHAISYLKNYEKPPSKVINKYNS